MGKWQPYREVTKPFEMSDFYKYSTRFRKPPGNSNITSPEVQNAVPVSQNKGIYQPLKPLSCHPLVPP